MVRCNDAAEQSGAVEPRQLLIPLHCAARAAVSALRAQCHGSAAFVTAGTGTVLERTFPCAVPGRRGQSRPKPLPARNRASCLRCGVAYRSEEHTSELQSLM